MTYRPIVEQLERLELFAANLFTNPFGEPLAAPFDPRPVVRLTPPERPPEPPPTPPGEPAPAIAAPGPAQPPPPVRMTMPPDQLTVLAGSGAADGGQLPPPLSLDRDTIQRAGKDDGEVYVRKVNRIGNDFPGGWYLGMSAVATSTAFPPPQQIDRHNIIHDPFTEPLYYRLPNGSLAGYATRVVTRNPTPAGLPGRFAAEAKAIAKTAFWSPQRVSWSSGGSFVAVRAGGQAVQGEVATAQFEIGDPVLWPEFAGESWEVGYTPKGAWNWYFPQDGVPSYCASANTSGYIWYEPHGLPSDEWFVWSVTLRSNGQKYVSFSSWDGLGLNDEQIAQEIDSRITFSGGRFTFNAAGFSLTAAFPATGDHEVQFQSSLGTMVTATDGPCGG